ncbi:hypothetical protein BDR07DRAFT_1498781 [Suillus spraguei]|nr:hypothetical protein BDR07DRAFT_1498781 [Suillus spraguei]
MPAHHSHAAFGTSGTVSSHGQALLRPSSFASSSGISCSLSTPSSTPSSSPYPPSDYCIALTGSQTSLSAKPQSSMSSRKKRTLAADVQECITMVNDDIQSMRSNMSERQQLKNERYAIKMDYQMKKKEF